MIHRINILAMLLTSSAVITSALRRWTCIQTNNVADEYTSDHLFTFITRGSGRNTWLQRNDEAATDPEVTGMSPQMIVQRTWGRITITLDFSNQEKLSIKRQFKVSEN